MPYKCFQCVILFFITFSTSVFASEDFYLPPVTPEASGNLITIKGSNTLGAKLVPTWAKKYLELKGVSHVRIEAGAKENEYKILGLNGDLPVNIQVHAHGSGTGFKSLLDRSAQIAISSRPIKSSENTLVDANVDLRSFETEHVVALDGLAIVVHPQNPIQRLSKQQVAKIFSGEITSWAEVGGHPTPINIYARDNKSGTWDTFKSLVLEKKYPLSSNAKRFESNDQLSDLVAEDIRGIGFVGLASVRKAKSLGISEGNGRTLQPTPLFVATEDYALSRRLFMYSLPYTQNQFSREFLMFVQSNLGQTTVEDIGFVSLAPISTPVKSVNGPDYYTNITKNGERVSINFSFKEGSAVLDNKAQRDVIRLSKFIKNASNQGKLIQLIGFGDIKSTEKRAIVLSKLRAIAVKTALHDYGVFTEPVLGLGSDLTLANSDGNMAHKNRRVEVWVFDSAEKGHLLQAKKDASRRKRQESTTELMATGQDPY